VYNGQGLGPTVVTSVAGVEVGYTFNGSAQRPVNAGTYTVVAVPADGNYAGSATGSFTIERAPQYAWLELTDPGVPLRFATAPVALKAWSSSGLPVNVTVDASGPAKLNANNELYDIQAEGVVTVRLNQPGNANVQALPEVVVPLDVAKVNQRIGFQLQATAPLGGAAIPLEATATSGLPVSFSVARGPASVVEGRLVTSGAGEVWVQATQAGDSTRNVAPPVTRVLRVEQAGQVIQFAALSRVAYGQGPVTLTATATSGLPVGYVVVSGPGRVSGAVLTVTGAGEILVRAMQAGDANTAAAAPVDQLLVVEPRALTVTVKAASRAYGQANPAFVLEYAGLAEGDTAEMITPPVAATEATTLSAPGSYAVRLSGGSAANYTLRRQDGTLTVTKAPQVISFPVPLNQAVGNPPFGLGAVASSGLAPVYTVVSGPATVAGNVLTVTGAGTVVVKAGQAGDANHEAAAEVERSFTVAAGIGVAGVTAEQAAGAYGAGTTIRVQVNFTGVVSVVGTPQLALNTTPARSATYVSGANTGTLVFEYVVQAGDTAAVLDYVGSGALTATGGAIRNAAGTASAALGLPTPGGAGSLAQNKPLAVDTTAPVVRSFSSVTADGVYRTGAQIALQATMSEAVRAGGGLAVTLSTGAVVNLTAAVAGPVLGGTYTVRAGDQSPALTVTGYTTGTVADLAGNALATTTVPAENLGTRSLAVRTQAPGAPGIPVVTALGGTVVANTLNTTNTGLRVTSTVEAGAAAGGRGRLYLAGKLLATDAQIAAADTQVEFELGGSTAAALQAVVPVGGALSVEVEDAAGNVSALSTTSSLSVDYSPPVVTVTLPAQVRLGETAAVVFSFNKPVGSLDATSLVVSGGTVGNLTGSGIQFTGIFTPSASSGSTAAVTAGAGFARDAAGNPSLRSDQAALRVEAAGAVSVTGVSSPNTDGAYRAGSVITVEVAFSNAVTVSGAPAIDLAVKPARQAAYVSGSGGKVLTFRYEVREGDAGEPLDYDGSSALRLNGGSIVNLSGSVASLVLPVPGAAGSLAAGRNIRVDTTSPLVLIRSDRSVLRAGETAAITFELSEASTDFTASDVRVTNGTLGGFSGSGRQYSAVVTPNAGLSGAVGITVEAGAFSDAAGNVSLPGALSLENVRFAWAATWGGSIRDEVMSTGVDRDGNVYLAGRFSGTSAFDPANPLAVTMAQGGTDAFVSKFDRAGKFLWSRSFGGVGADEIRAMAISPLGGVILTGSFSGRVDFDPGTGVSESVSSGASDIFVLSLSPSGAFGWVRTLGGAGSDSGRALALDGNGFILVGGTFEGQVDFDPGVGQRLLGSSGANDGFLMKFSPSGIPLGPCHRLIGGRRCPRRGGRLRGKCLRGRTVLGHGRFRRRDRHEVTAIPRHLRWFCGQVRTLG